MVFQFQKTKRATTFDGALPAQWASWTWQLQNALTTEVEFKKVYTLSEDEIEGFKYSGSLFKVSATPYYASLGLESDSLRRILMPEKNEALAGSQQMLDPLDENHNSPTSRIIHRYSDRVLFLLTDMCSVYCRFCTRKRFTGKDDGLIPKKDYEEALDYIRTHTGIREVIFSGGDPLTLSNKVLGKALEGVRAIPHVEILRLGSRMPTVCPMRIDEELCGILRKCAPVYMMTHFSHPKELTFEAKSALEMLVDHGIPVFNQMVLLNGINNHPAIIQALSRRLLYLRVKPYYMFQCDPSEGTDHLRTTVESSEEIVKELWGHLSGLAMPTFSLDIPSGGGKTTLAPSFLVKNENGIREYQGWDGRKGIYKNPDVKQLIPEDAGDYFKEWEDLKNAKVLSSL